MKTYVEMIIEGPEEYARGYIRGFVAARGSHAEVIFDDEVGIDEDDIVQKIKEALHLTREVTHAMVDAETAALVREAITTAQDVPLTVRSERTIDHARFEYKFGVYNREQGDLIINAFKDLPTGITLVDHDLHVKEDPSAHGKELYSPAHEYSVTGQGAAEGPIDKIIWLYKELTSVEQLTAEDITLVFKENQA
ncbi:MAG TPA: hypothetical protein PKW95_08915 [bacterium]|nr:hypothetical protein [bacterium]